MYSLNNEISIKMVSDFGYIIWPQYEKKEKINQMGGIILSYLYEERTLNDVVTYISELTNENIETIQEDVCVFVNDMKEKNIVIENQKQCKKIISRPLHKATLQLTNKCNLRCNHCLSESGVAADDELSTEEWKRVIDQLHLLGVYELVLTGGEIFVRDDIIELLEYMNGRFFINILTNGIAITDSKLNQIKDIKINSIQVSLDGAREQTNDAIRGKGTYHQIINRIEKLVDEKFTVSISATITKSNFDELDEFIKLADSLQVASIGFGEVLDMGRASEMDNGLLDEEQVIYLNEFSVQQVSEHIQSKTKIGPYLDNDINFDISAPQKKARDLCGAIRDAIYISNSGCIAPCLQLVQFDEFISGNVRTDTIENVWIDSDIHKELRDLSVNDCDECSVCDYKIICGGSCRALAYKEHGKLTGGPNRIICKSTQRGLEYAANLVGEKGGIKAILSSMAKNIGV